MKELTIKGFPVLLPKGDIYIKSQPFPSLQQGSKSIKEGDAGCKGRKAARDAVQCCLLHMTGLCTTELTIAVIICRR